MCVGGGHSKTYTVLSTQAKDKSPEHLHGKTSFATQVATAGSDGSGGANKGSKGKLGKKDGPNLAKYAGLPDDISVGNLPKV